ncbi:MAG: hypothetical protein HY902_05960, partial [Deltaproteobacteria bacterium]|nr:hypothetical protein [Deltaproteobacteria bacterium]
MRQAQLTRLLGRPPGIESVDYGCVHGHVQGAPTDAEVRACAMLAAHLSGLAKGDRAEVSVCAGKGVKKVKGAPAG